MFSHMVLTHVLTVSKGYSYTLSLLALLVHSRVPTRNTFAHGLHKFTTLAFCQWPLDSLDSALAIPPER